MMQRVHPFVNCNTYKYCGQDEHEMNHPSDRDSWTCDLAIDYRFNPRPIDVPQNLFQSIGEANPFLGDTKRNQLKLPLRNSQNLKI
jgi:hypothetical protein